MDKKIEELMAELAKERAKSAHLKNLLDRALSEKANFKRVLSDREEEEEKRKKREETLEMEIYNLHNEMEAISFSKKFINMGMNEEKALETARALLNKDTNTFDKNIAAHIEEIKKAEQDKAIQKFLAENHTEVNAGYGDSGSSSAENIALKHVRNIKVNENDLENFK